MNPQLRVVLVVAAIVAYLGFRISLKETGKRVSEDRRRETFMSNLGTPRREDATWRVPAIIAVLCVGVGAWVYLKNREIEQDDQAARDKEAERIRTEWAYESDRQIDSLLKEGNEEPFVLYLRPFALEHRYSQKYTFLRLLRPGGVLEPSEVRFDYLLVKSLASLEIPVICLGHRKSVPGAGHVETSLEEWEAVFHRLAWRAKAIVFVPGDGPGIVEEFRWLKSSWMIGKAAFFRPLRYPKPEWDAARAAFAAEGGDLPEWERCQVSFRMNPAGRHLDVARWRRSFFTTQARTENDLRSTVLFRDLG